MSFADIRAGLSTMNVAAGEIDGDFQLNPEMRDFVVDGAKKHAAVLIGLVERVEGIHVILTMRTEKLSSHSAQVAFPGGKIDRADISPEAAALREAWEEIGLETSEVQVLGRLPNYYTGSGFMIAPVLGEVSSTADFEINSDEVDYMFEVPLAFLLDNKNHIQARKHWQGRERHFYEIPYEGHYIWGVTAGIIRVMHDRIFAI